MIKRLAYLKQQPEAFCCGYTNATTRYAGGSRQSSALFGVTGCTIRDQSGAGK
ncbi:MAG: hypothetical protein RMJ55_00210 [Roseiflexaceae bacterium]|nr:hypothetical protein [Roseiflexaceae bacterium]